MANIKSTINANGVEIRITSSKEADYISLTDIAKKRNPEFPADVVKNWLRSRSTIEFLGLWEKINNPDFKLVEFDQFKNSAGENSFVLTPQKWIASTNAIGITSKSGRYGGTYAHSDIAFEFASWISPEFKLYIIKDYQRLKADESHTKQLDWNVKREIAKSNYRIHTDAIKENLPPNLTPQQIAYTYAQLIVLANLESMNADYIREGMPAAERLVKLNKIAIYQLESLWREPVKSIEKLKSLKLPAEG